MFASVADNTFLHSKCPVLTLDSAGVILSANSAFCSLFGYDGSDLVGVKYETLVNKVAYREFDHVIARFFQSGIVKNVLESIRGKSGEFIQTRLDAYAVYDDEGNPSHGYVILEPVNAGLPNYDQIYNATSVPLMIYDSSTLDIVDVNYAACMMYGYSYLEFIKMNLGDVNADGREKTMMYVRDITTDNKKKYIFRHRMKDGRIRFVEVWPTPLIYARENMICSVLFDITERYNHERNIKAVAELSSRLLDASVDIKDVSCMLVESVKELTGASNGFAGSIDEDSQNLIIHYHSLLEKKASVTVEVDEDGRYPCLCGMSLEKQEVCCVNDVKLLGDDAALPVADDAMRNFMSCPVVLSGKLVGVIAASNCEHGFNEYDIQSVQELAKLYAIAINTQKDRETEMMYTELTQNTSDGVSIFIPADGDFIYKSINNAGADVLGSDVAELAGKKLSEMYPGVMLNGQMDLMNRVWETGSPVHQPLAKYEYADQEIWLDIFTFRLNKKYVVSIFRDVTEIIKAHQAVEESEEKYRSYWSHSPNPIMLLNEDATVAEANLAACEKFGYTLEEITQLRIFDLWPEYLREEYASNLKKHGKEEYFTVFHPHISKSGELFDIHVSVKKMPDGRLMGVMQDMTERVRMQRELNDLNADLHRRVKHEVAIREQQEKAIFEQKKLADMGQMLSAIAHHWRQPINGLGLMIQFVAEQFSEGSLTAEEMSHFCEESMDVIKGMSDTIDDFSMFCRPDSERVRFEVVVEVCRMMKLVEAQLAMEGIKFSVRCKCPHKSEYVPLDADCSCEYQSTVLEGYRAEFRQAMMNLIYNAVDSIHEEKESGGIKKGEISLVVESDHRMISLTCCDNGTGFTEDVLQKAFEPYFSTKPEGSGVGIGLYVTKLVVEKHMGGQIEAFNSADGGCVRLTFAKEQA